MQGVTLNFYVMKSLTTNSPSIWQAALFHLSSLGNAIIGKGKKKIGFRTGHTSNTRYALKRNIQFFQL